MKNSKKLFICLTAIILFINSCKDNTLEEIQYVAGMKCLEKTFEEYQNGKLISKQVNEYDNSNNLIKTIYTTPSSFTTLSYEYDKSNNLIKSFNEKLGMITTSEYNSDNKIVKTESSSGLNTYYEYYPNGQTKKITDYSFNVITRIREFDENGLPSKLYNTESYLLGDGITQNVVLKITKEIETISKYNSKGNLLSEYVTHNKKFFSSVEKEYNIDNREIKSTFKTETKTNIFNTSYEYDDKRKLISKKIDSGQEERYEYNIQGLLISKAYYAGEKLQSTIKNEYNTSQQLTKISSFDSKGKLNSKEDFTYFNNNKRRTYEAYYLRTGSETDFYKSLYYESNECGNLLKSFEYGADGTENRRIIMTYIYR